MESYSYGLFYHAKSLFFKAWYKCICVCSTKTEHFWHPNIKEERKGGKKLALCDGTFFYLMYWSHVLVIVLLYHLVLYICFTQLKMVGPDDLISGSVGGRKQSLGDPVRGGGGCKLFPVDGGQGCKQQLWNVFVLFDCI